MFQNRPPPLFPSALGGNYREAGWRSNLSFSCKGLHGGRTDGWVGLADREMLPADVINTWKLGVRSPLPTCMFFFSALGYQGIYNYYYLHCLPVVWEFGSWGWAAPAFCPRLPRFQVMISMEKWKGCASFPMGLLHKKVCKYRSTYGTWHSMSISSPKEKKRIRRKKKSRYGMSVRTIYLQTTNWPSFDDTDGSLPAQSPDRSGLFPSSPSFFPLLGVLSKVSRRVPPSSAASAVNIRSAAGLQE